MMKATYGWHAPLKVTALTHSPLSLQSLTSLLHAIVNILPVDGACLPCS